MLLIIVGLILLTVWLLANDERNKIRIKSLFVVKQIPPNCFDKTFPKSFVSIQTCEDILLRLTLKTEFMINGSYKPEPKRTLYYFGSLMNPEVYLKEYKSTEIDNFDIKVFENSDLAKDISKETIDGFKTIMFFSRSYVERFGEQDSLELPLKYLPSTFAIPIKSDSTQTYSGQLYTRPHDDGKYLELIYTRNPKTQGDIELSSDVTYMDVEKNKIILL
jgi:hypothetical protein